MPESSFSRRDEPVAQPLALRADPSSLLAALTAAANNPNMDIGKVERMFAMYQTVVKQQAEAAYNDAMARAQAEIQPVIAKSWNSHTSSHYAKLEAIDRVITPIHTAEGLSISYDTETKNDADPIPQGYLRTVAWVRHSGGHKERHHIDLPPDQSGSQGKTNKTMVQAISSTNTYARRILKLGIFNVSTYDDKDGNASRRRAEPEAENQQQQRPGELPFYPEDKFLKALPEWKQLLAGGRKTVEDIKTTVGSKYRFTPKQETRLNAAAGEKQ